jgi:hypothetical protein
VDLALVSAFIRRQHLLQHKGWGRALMHALQAQRPQQRVHQRLGRHRADPALGVHTQGAHRKKSGGDGHTECAIWGSSQQRPGHVVTELVREFIGLNGKAK